jgi:hypothetical protein
LGAVLLETLETAHAYNEVGEAAFRNGDHQIAKAYFQNAASESLTYFEQAYEKRPRERRNEERTSRGGS